MQRLTDAFLRRWPLPSPEKGGSKEHRGRVLIIAGANEMPGAAILASTAALRAGCGKVRVAVPEDIAVAVGCAVPELRVLPFARANRNRRASFAPILDSARTAAAVLIGSGMLDDNAVRYLLGQFFRRADLGALVVDARALRLLPSTYPSKRPRFPLILTPHFSEAAALCEVSPEDITREPLRYARAMARRFSAVVVLKGAETFVCGPDSKRAYLNQRGNIGLATAGSGDVLAGIVAGLAARGAEPLQAAAWAVSLHARAGERLAQRIGPVGYLARELADPIPALLAALSGKRKTVRV